MPLERMHRVLSAELDDLRAAGPLKGDETVFRAVVPPQGGLGPRFLLEGEGDQPFLRMNSNSYLGLSLDEEVIEAEESASRTYGAGPGAVRFISGSWSPHVELEERLADFHGREAAMIFSSAYAATISVLVPLITKETTVISDELNHNCIINAMRLARPAAKRIYRHCDLGDLEAGLEEAVGTCKRVIVVTDGIFSMRGDHAPLREIVALVRRFDDSFEEGVILLVDDSHGVASFGATGRGTEEFTGCEGVDLTIATLGKALGVNGGYVVGSRTVLRYLREKAPIYIYSNPITPAEAAAAVKALEIVEGPKGQALLEHLRAMTRKFEKGLTDLGYETIPGEHPVVPLMVRDTAKTTALVAHLREHHILATGLNFPVVPKGDEEIRFQINASHTEADIEECLAVLESFPGR